MPKFIAKFKDRYCEWSTVVDAPITPMLTLPQLEAYIKEEYGNTGLRILGPRVLAAEAYGTSGDCTIADLLSCNRAGKRGGKVATVAAMLELYKDKDSEEAQGLK